MFPMLDKRTTNKLSLIAITLITLVAVYQKQVSVFYMIYLFWFDEVIRSIFDWLALKFQPNLIENKSEFKSNLSGRFFLLSIYFVFIVVIFGFIIDFKNQDLMLLNLQTLLFRNPWFDLSLLSIISREYLQFYHQSEEQISSNNSFSAGMIVLHISIIFGTFFFFFVNNVINPNFDYTGNLGALLAILPFLSLKLIVEWLQLRKP